MERRTFLAQMAAGAAAGLLDGQLFAQETQPARPRPNFLIILTDDQRWDALGVVQREQGDRARFPWLKTPNLDQFADTGVRFSNAFVVLSLCSPSRASFLTGQYGQINGVLHNRIEFPTTNTTFASLLHEAGYSTAHIGKWHMFRQTDRPGFDYTATFVEQGEYVDCPFLVNGEETPTQGWVDDVSTDYAIKYLENHRDKPFAMLLGYKSTHDNYQPPPRLASEYEGQTARPVPNLDSLPPYPRWTPKKERDRPKELLDYMRCVTAIDENVGRLMAQLADLGLDQNTIVIFAGDNGFHLGEHGNHNKRDAYEESMRIPLLMRCPGMGVQEKLVDEMVLNIDLAPTILDYAGVAIPKTMQGRSWRPLLEGRSADWREAFFYEYIKEGENVQWPSIYAVRTAQAKLIQYDGHPEWAELYDLTDDPYETNNLINDPAKQELRKELERDLIRLQSDVMEGKSLRAASRASGNSPAASQPVTSKETAN